MHITHQIRLVDQHLRRPQRPHFAADSGQQFLAHAAVQKDRSVGQWYVGNHPKILPWESIAKPPFVGHLLHVLLPRGEIVANCHFHECLFWQFGRMIGKVVKFPRFKTVAAPTGPVARVDIYIQRYFAERFFAITHVDQVCAVIDFVLDDRTAGESGWVLDGLRRSQTIRRIYPTAFSWEIIDPERGCIMNIALELTFGRNRGKILLSTGPSIDTRRGQESKVRKLCASCSCLSRQISQKLFNITIKRTPAVKQKHPASFAGDGL